MNRLKPFLMILAFALLIVSDALAAPKNVLDETFAYVKHGELYLTGMQGPQHSIGSHLGWARGQTDRAVAKEIVFRVLLAYHGMATNASLGKDDLNRGFAHIKQGELILTGRTGPQHSLGSHEGWARGESRQSVINAIDYELVTIRDTLFPAL